MAKADTAGRRGAGLLRESVAARVGGVACQTDIFSLGVVLYELLAGARPFRASEKLSPRERNSQLWEFVKTRDPRQVNDSVPKEFERNCLKTLAKRKPDRYTTARDMANDLRHFAATPAAQEAASVRVQLPAARDGALGASLPTPPLTPTPDPSVYAQFLDQSVAALTEEGKIISVRLALFAEMVKSKPWTPETLQAIGGVEGVGVTFLEETFSAGNAPIAYRTHQVAERGVLKALLPEIGTDIKGHQVRSDELLQAGGYAQRPRDFDTLLRILDRDLRLITPVEGSAVAPRQEEPNEDAPSLSENA